MTMLRIKELAQARGIENISQLALAARLTYPQAWRYWNNKTSRLDTDTLVRISQTLGVQVGDLFVRDETLDSPPR